MRIYIDIGHPAYAHAFRHFIVEMKRRGHQVLLSGALDKVVELLGRDDLHEEWLKKRDTMLAGKVDLTSWMIELVGE